MVIVIVLSTLLGLLTHYFFVIISAGCVIYWLATNSYKERKSLVVVVATSIGHALFVAIHPQFYLDFLEQAAPEPGYHLLFRIQLVVVTFIPLLYIFIPFFLGLKHRYTLNRQTAMVLWIFFWNTSVVVALYLFGISPIHAMSGKYLAVSWPFLSFLPAILISSLKYPSLHRVYYAITPLIIFPVMMYRLHNYTPLSNPLLIDTLQKNLDLVIIDNTQRTVVLSILWHIPDEQLVLITYQNNLITQQTDWTDKLGKQSLYLGSTLHYNNTENLNKVIDIIEKENYSITTLRERGGINYYLMNSQ